MAGINKKSMNGLDGEPSEYKSRPTGRYYANGDGGYANGFGNGARAMTSGESGRRYNIHENECGGRDFNRDGGCIYGDYSDDQRGNAGMNGNGSPYNGRDGNGMHNRRDGGGGGGSSARRGGCGRGRGRGDGRGAGRGCGGGDRGRGRGVMRGGIGVGRGCGRGGSFSGGASRGLSGFMGERYNNHYSGADGNWNNNYGNDNDDHKNTAYGGGNNNRRRDDNFGGGDGGFGDGACAGAGAGAGAGACGGVGDTECIGPQKPRELYIPPEPTNNEDEIFGSGISSGINFSKYDSIPVQVTGENPPKPLTSFKDGNLHDLVLNNIIRSGYITPTPIQKTAIPVISGGRDLMACAQTGSGKTAAFLIPIINTLLKEKAIAVPGRPHAIIVSPTRELAIQTFHEARKFSYGSVLNVRLVYGGTSSKYQFENISKGATHILICTPGRLLDFVEKAFILFENIRFVILDEADRLLEMGFKASVASIMNHATMPTKINRQNLMFSATFPKEIQRMAGEYLNNYVYVAIGAVGAACADVTQIFHKVPMRKKNCKLLEELEVSNEGTIIFVQTKKGADFLANLLNENNIPTTSMHGDRYQRQREQALRDFKCGKMKVLIATSVAARGLDIKNVNHVINFDLPSTIDDYVHRIGRTGRVGNKGIATSFYDPQRDSVLANDLVRILKGAGQQIPDFLRHVDDDDTEDFEFGGSHDVRENIPQINNNMELMGPTGFEEEEDWI